MLKLGNRYLDRSVPLQEVEKIACISQSAHRQSTAKELAMLLKGEDFLEGERLVVVVPDRVLFLIREAFQDRTLELCATYVAFVLRSPRGNYRLRCHTQLPITHVWPSFAAGVWVALTSGDTRAQHPRFAQEASGDDAASLGNWEKGRCKGRQGLFRSYSCRQPRVGQPLAADRSDHGIQTLKGVFSSCNPCRHSTTTVVCCDSHKNLSFTSYIVDNSLRFVKNVHQKGGPPCGLGIVPCALGERVLGFGAVLCGRTCYAAGNIGVAASQPGTPPA